MPLTWTDGQGVAVTKTFVFRRGSTRSTPATTCSNGSPRPWKAASYVQFCATRVPHEAIDVRRREICLPRPGRLRRREVPEARKSTTRTTSKFRRAITGGWMAAMQHHFVAAIVPPAGATYRIHAAASRATTRWSATAARSRACPARRQGSSRRRCSSVRSCRPAQQGRPGLEHTVDYGKLRIIAQPLFFVLSGCTRRPATGAGRSSS